MGAEGSTVMGAAGGTVMGAACGANCLMVGTNFSDALFMQYRLPVGCGPSLNTCPK